MPNTNSKADETEDQTNEQPDTSLGMSDAEFLASMNGIPKEEPAKVEPTGGDKEAVDGTVLVADTKTDTEADDKLTESKDTSTDEAKKVDAEINFEEEYKKILAPFKANGKELKVDNIDEALTLMKMGANYNKKMAALKPGLKVLKLLESSNLLDPNEIGFLIDLKNKNPQAIAKLLKDSKIEPLSIDIESESTYTPSPRTVGDHELELDSIMESLNESPHYPKVLDLVTTKWDVKSRNVVATEPQLLTVLNDHMANGIYDVINTAVNKQKVLGRLNGMSDIEAYRLIGDELNSKGAFNDLVKPKAIIPPQVKVTPKEDSELLSKKKAAAPSKPNVTQATQSNDFNPLSISDDDFMKSFNKF